MSVFSQAPYEKSETTLCFLSVTFADKIQAPLMDLQWGGASEMKHRILLNRFINEV